MPNNDNEALTSLLKKMDSDPAITCPRKVSEPCAGCEFNTNDDKCDTYARKAAYLIENGVGLFPPANIENKCGSCIYAKPVVAFGGSRSYVSCTNKEHINRFCHREISTLRQRTHPACKSYKAKEQPSRS